VNLLTPEFGPVTELSYSLRKTYRAAVQIQCRWNTGPMEINAASKRPFAVAGASALHRKVPRPCIATTREAHADSLHPGCTRIASALHEVDPMLKTEVYADLGLRIYQPAGELVLVAAAPRVPSACRRGDSTLTYTVSNSPGR
jgi:hypothetical protein